MGRPPVRCTTVESQAIRGSDIPVSLRVGRRRVASADRTSVASMNRSQLIDRVAGDAQLPRPAAARAIDATLAAIEMALRDGDDVALTGFGRFHVGSYTGRPGVNPRTGERIEVATTRVPRFAAGSRLRAAVR
jgi:DNA-binding protein HU-beta